VLGQSPTNCARSYRQRSLSTSPPVAKYVYRDSQMLWRRNRRKRRREPCAFRAAVQSPRFPMHRSFHDPCYVRCSAGITWLLSQSVLECSLRERGRWGNLKLLLQISLTTIAGRAFVSPSCEICNSAVSTGNVHRKAQHCGGKPAIRLPTPVTSSPLSYMPTLYSVCLPNTGAILLLMSCCMHDTSRQNYTLGTSPD